MEEDKDEVSKRTRKTEDENKEVDVCWATLADYAINHRANIQKVLQRIHHFFTTSPICN